MSVQRELRFCGQRALGGMVATRRRHRAGVGIALAALIGVFGLLGGIAKAASKPVISETFPPARDVRSPDRTVADVQPGRFGAIAYAPDGRTLVTGALDGAELFTARTGEESAGESIRKLAGSPAPVTAVAFWNGGKQVVGWAGDAILAWTVESGELAPIVQLAERFDVGAFAPGDRSELALARGKAVSIVDRATGALLQKLEVHGRVGCLAFAPDGATLAVGTDRGRVHVYDVATAATARELNLGSPVRACALAGTHLAAGGAGKLALWSFAVDEKGFVAKSTATAPGKPPESALEAPAKTTREGRAATPTATEPAPRLVSLRAPRGGVTALAFASKKGELAAAGAGGVVDVWDVATGQRLCEQTGHAGAIHAVAFNGNGQKLATSGADRSLRFWTVPLNPIEPDLKAAIAAALPEKPSVVPKKPRRVLVFWRADAILHKSGVPAGNEAIAAMGKKTKAFTADFSRDTAVFAPDILRRYDAIIFNSTAHLVMPDEGQRKALLDYVAGGGGVVGIHAAIDMWKRWPQGAAVIGATFAGHPWNPKADASWAVKLEDPEHPLLRAFNGKSFRIRDEFYELGPPYSREDRRVLMTLDASDAATGSVTPIHRADRDFAVAWIKPTGTGRVFYGMFGHVGESFANPSVLRFYLDGIQYALGDLTVDDSPSKPPAPRP